MKAVNKLAKLIVLSQSQKYLLLKAAVLVGGIRVGLAVFSYSKVKHLLDRTGSGPHRPTKPPSYLDDVVWAVRAIARRTLGDKPCLIQALAAQWLLRRTGYATTLRIGVTKKSDHELRAHAWLEYDGDIIIGGCSSPLKYTSLRSMSDAVPSALSFRS